MRAVILAAGRGRRLGRLGEDRPKCLVELAGRALLDRQIAALRAGGIEEIGIVRGYRADLLQRPGLVGFHNHRWADTNMVASLATATEWLRSGPLIVSYGDIFYPSELVRRLADSAGRLVISYDRAWRELWVRRFTDPLSDAETFRVDPTGILLEIGGRTARIGDIEGQYMGLLKFTPDAWRSVEALLEGLDPRARDALDLTGMLRALLARDALPVQTVGTEGGWGEIDSPGDLELYESMIRNRELVLEDVPSAVSGAESAGIDWDYTAHAPHYDRRADYSRTAIEELLTATGCVASVAVADIGAGTGKLTKQLLGRGLVVKAVEPNPAMRAIGIGNTRGLPVDWSDGTGEATGLPPQSVHAAFFGSSFNVVDQRAALAEVWRILRPQGWFACLWNHRDLDDPVQRMIESIIRSYLPGYSHGSRREDPTRLIESSGHFGAVHASEHRFDCEMSSPDIVTAWRSHATLRRQAGSDATFERVVGAIANYLAGLPATVTVPYATRIYWAQRAN